MNSYRLLRYSFGILFIWFGILKVFNVSPVTSLIAQVVPFSFPLQLPLIGLFEIVLGVSFFLKHLHKISPVVMIVYLLGIMVLVLLRKGFSPWFPLLSFEGEFALKNLVCIASGFVLMTEENKEKNKIE